MNNNNTNDYEIVCVVCVQDMWHEVWKHRFTVEQLDDLSGVASAPSYVT